MVAVPMPPAQAAKLGLDVKVRKRMTRTTTRAPYRTVCSTVVKYLLAEAPRHDVADGRLAHTELGGKVHLAHSTSAVPIEDRPGFIVRELGVAIPGTAKVLADLDAMADENSVDRAGIMAELFSDPDRAESLLVELLGPLRVDRGAVMSSMESWRHHLEVFRSVVRPVLVNVVDVLVGPGPHDRAVLVPLDILIRQIPGEDDVATGSDVAGRRLAWWCFTGSEPPCWLHGFIIRAACLEEFWTRAAEDRHVEATNHARYELVLQ